MTDIIEQIGAPALLENYAEECMEAAHAAMKMARYLRGENPTDAEYEDLVRHLHEETADVYNLAAAVKQAGLLDMCQVTAIMVLKEDRWRKRLEGIPYRKPEILPGPPKDKEAQRCEDDLK